MASSSRLRCERERTAADRWLREHRERMLDITLAAASVEPDAVVLVPVDDPVAATEPAG